MSTVSRTIKLASACAATIIMVAAPQSRADEAALLEKIKQLENRLVDLEGKSTQTVTQASIPAETLDFLGQTKISGYVSASYFYNFSKGNIAGTGGMIPGRLFDVNNNSFMINKLKLTLEKPLDYSATDWQVGYRADVIVGQDAPAIHSTGLFGGFASGQSIDLEQAFVGFNVPIGNGLKISMGRMVTMMGVEVIEETVNPNWSIGNQFMFAENTTMTGIHFSYKWNDKWDSQFCVINGWDQVTDVNASKSFMGRVGFTPNDKTAISVIGYGGPEQAGNNSNWREGIDIVLNRKLTDKLTLWLQGDYGHEDNAPAAVPGGVTANADWWGVGGWLTYDFTAKVGAALRADYFVDKDGSRTSTSSGGPITAPAQFTAAPKELTSVTLTLTLKPIKNLQVRPEIRWDHSSAATAFNGSSDQFTAGLGVAYLF